MSIALAGRYLSLGFTSRSCNWKTVSHVKRTLPSPLQCRSLLLQVVSCLYLTYKITFANEVDWVSCVYCEINIILCQFGGLTIVKYKFVYTFRHQVNICTYVQLNMKIFVVLMIESKSIWNVGIQMFLCITCHYPLVMYTFLWLNT